MNYGDLIRDAIRITRHNRYLWFFGFFVGLGSGGSGGGGGGGGGDFDEQNSAEIASVAALAAQRGPFDNVLLIVALVVLVLLIFLVFFALYVVSQGGLTESVAAIGIALLIVIFIPLAIIRQFARRELVVRGVGILGSVGTGYRLFRRNLGTSLLVWLIQL
ncbi:MAG: hypothetical protein LC704_03535, partial [Actinobacteria bacterium]|nr:hypothetical protein [Actinomycetota bacterium]